MNEKDDFLACGRTAVVHKIIRAVLYYSLQHVNFLFRHFLKKTILNAGASEGAGK